MMDIDQNILVCPFSLEVGCLVFALTLVIEISADKLQNCEGEKNTMLLRICVPWYNVLVKVCVILPASFESVHTIFHDACPGFEVGSEFSNLSLQHVDLLISQHSCLPYL
jgi:hypothetical protein